MMKNVNILLGKGYDCNVTILYTEDEVANMTEQEKNLFFEERTVEYLEEQLNIIKKQLQEEFLKL
jgi:hypothetical protein